MKNALLHLAYKVYGLRWRITRPVVIGVRIMLVRDGQVIMVRHTYQDRWFFPGGSVKRGETLAEAASREAREEVGAYLRSAPALLGIYLDDRASKSDHVALFVSHDFGLAEATDCWEIEAWSFFPMDALPATRQPGSGHRVRDYQARADDWDVSQVGRW